MSKYFLLNYFIHIAMGYQKHTTALCNRSTGKLTNRYSYKQLAETTVYRLTTHMIQSTAHFLSQIKFRDQRWK